MHDESLCLEDGVGNRLAKATVCCVLFEKKYSNIFPRAKQGNRFFFFVILAIRSFVRIEKLYIRKLTLIFLFILA